MKSKLFGKQTRCLYCHSKAVIHLFPFIIIFREREIIRGVIMLMNSRGLIHEDSLLKMKIIPQSMHSKFGTLMKAFRHGSAPGAVEWTALGIWLQINWNQGLDQLVSSLKPNNTRTHQTVRESYVTDKLDLEETADDQWDKEHIDEIQGTLLCIKKTRIILT